MTFRSLQMQQFQMIIPRDSAYLTINLLGHENALHFTDAGDPANRQFTQMIRRCDDCLQKIDIIKQALKKQRLNIEQYDQTGDVLISQLGKSWKMEAQNLHIQQIKLIDIYEQRVTQEYKKFLDLSNRRQKIQNNHTQILQKIACFQILSECLDNPRPKLQNEQYYIKNVSQINQVKGISFLVGAISNDMEWKLSKIIYRVSRGYACTRTMDKFKFFGLKNFNKKVILVIYPSSDSQILQRRLKNVMQSFCEYTFSLSQFEYSAKNSLNNAVGEYNQIFSIMEMNEKQYGQYLQSVKKISNIETWRLFFWKQKYLYQYLNKCDRREQFMIANVYIPQTQIKRISLAVNRIVPNPILNQIPIQQPPTAFLTNEYTYIAQQITDTYGIPRYQQLNPSIFATVTFPFFFGVMFGDVIHGAMIFALGIYAIRNAEQLKKGNLKILAQMKYIITMMGFFALYCGFIYNDFAGFNYNLFGSCYSPPLHPKSGNEEQKQQRPVHSFTNCVYPFGIDPVWGRAENELVFINSLKMKISVIIAIIHMTLGVCCKAANSLYFKKKLDFYFEFIPQFIFLVFLFGYMDFLIIFKWLKVWNIRYDDIHRPQEWAPSIISTMMNIGLNLGKTSTKPDGNSNMWGQPGHSSQDTIQILLLIIGLICIPWMLIPKPYIEIKKLNKISNKRINPLANEDDLMEQSKQSLKQRLNQNKISKAEQEQILKQGESSSEIVVHQLIETIEYVLGAISNTASYLRLWALSLAHSQLSKVFFQQTAGRFVGDKYMFVQILSLFLGTYMVMWITFGIILCMDSMECFLHALRLHWVEFQNKFYKGDGFRYNPLSFRQAIQQCKHK